MSAGRVAAERKAQAVRFVRGLPTGRAARRKAYRASGIPRASWAFYEQLYGQVLAMHDTRDRKEGTNEG